MKIYLVVPFESKDTVKAEFPIKWDNTVKKWYYLSNDGEVPKGLEKYKLMYVKINYEDRTMLKEKYKSLSWDAGEKSWYCNPEDFLKISG